MRETNFSDSQKTALRTWLKLLGVSNQMRKHLQSRLMDTHGISLSRFDVLANLYRAPDAGIRLSDLSKQLMVSNGNVTQVIAPMIKDGFVVRQTSEKDARVSTARLSQKGISLFEIVAADHARWVEELLADLGSEEQHQITQLLSQISNQED